MSGPQVIIVGGGIAGPVAALALARAGLPATVYEAYPGPAYGVGGVLSLEANGLDALELVGAGDAVRALSYPIGRSVLALATGRTIDLPAVPGLPARRVIERAELHRALHDRAVEAGITVEYGRRLAAVDEDAEGVTARFADGSSVRAHVLVGADGIHSTVRRMIDADAPRARYQGMLGFGGYVDAPVEVAPGTMTFAFGTRAYYLYWRVPDGRIAWGANLPRPDALTVAQARLIPAEEWLRQLRATYAGDRPGEVLAHRTAADALVVNGPLHIMPPVPHWHSARMVLVGDAVHAPSNSTGQGASLAIESAVELARCLRDHAVPQAFARYVELRRPRVERIAARGAATGRVKAAAPGHDRSSLTSSPADGVEEIYGWERRFTIDWARTA